MMNLYREEQPTERKTIGEKVKDLKESIMLNIKTSRFARNKSIKRVTEAINQVNPKDTESLRQIYNVINRLDLVDGRFGKQLNIESFNEFIRKVEKNGNLKEISESLKNNSICYEISENEKNFE